MERRDVEYISRQMKPTKNVTNHIISRARYFIPNFSFLSLLQHIYVRFQSLPTESNVMLRRRDEVELIDGICAGCFFIGIFVLSIMFLLPNNRRNQVIVVENEINSTRVDEIQPQLEPQASGSNLTQALNETQVSLKNKLEKLKELINSLSKELDSQSKSVEGHQVSPAPSSVTTKSPEMKALESVVGPGWRLKETGPGVYRIVIP